MQSTFNTEELPPAYVPIDINSASFAKNEINEMSDKILNLAVANLVATNSNIKNVATTILERIIKNVGDRIDAQLNLSVNNQQIQTSSNPTDPDQWAWDDFLSVLYQPPSSFAGNGVTYYFVKNNSDLSVYSIFSLLVNSLTREEMIKSLTDLNTKLPKPQKLAARFIKEESTELFNTSTKFKNMGIPVTLLIKSAISLGLLPESVINEIWNLINKQVQ